jgi:hypothetical protein
VLVRLVVGGFGVAVVLDAANQALQRLCGVLGRLTTRRMHADAGAVLPLLVDDLVDELLLLRELKAGLFALVLDLLGPLRADEVHKLRVLDRR